MRRRRVLAGGITVAVASLALSGSAAQAASPHWSRVSSPNTSSTQFNYLSGVTCVSSSFCMAAGFYSNGTNRQTLIELRNGGSWGLVSSPNSSTTQDNFLNGVSCVNSSFCMAVGDYSNGSIDQTLIAKWNGSTWSRVSSPNSSSTQSNDLSGVGCVTTSFCIAAGDYFNGTNRQTLIEKWNGSSWSLVNSPNTGTHDNNFYGVSCVSSSFCMAVGAVYNGTNEQTLIERWNGTGWSLDSSPNTSATQSNNLYGASCFSASFCMAAGAYVNGSDDQTLIEKWNGSSWARVGSPNSSAVQSNDLNGVSCVSASFCMAAGFYHSSVDQTLIERWNGSGWSRVSSPNSSSSQQNDLNGVSCVSSSSCAAAGAFSNGTNDQTLIERW